MQDRIRVVRSTETAPLLAVVEDGPGQAGADGSFDFCMCNPPFYKDPEQIEQSRKAKSTAPAAVCMGTSGEMITDGGEVAFVSRMVHESLVLRGRVRWYSSLLGFRSSARAIETLLRIEGVPVVRCDAFRQGPTTRWVVAWSFGTPESAEPAGSPSDSAELPSHLAGSKRKAPPDEPESEARRARRV
nr:hypothetical protein HK105_001277 [Polyrhizophydium stewartii]